MCLGIEGEAICDIENPSYPDIEDSECPLHSSEPIFLPGPYCDEYYICLNGVPHIMICRKGQHWNMEMNYCDAPHEAGCEVRKSNTYFSNNFAYCRRFIRLAYQIAKQVLVELCPTHRTAIGLYFVIMAIDRFSSVNIYFTTILIKSNVF